MRIKKFMSVLLVMALIFSFCSFFVSAADDGVINTIDMHYYVEVGTSVGVQDITSQTDVSIVTNSMFKDFVSYSLPHSNYPTSSDVQRHLVGLKLFDNYNFNSNHEYNLTFSYGFNISLAFTCKVSLVYYDSNNNILKTQELVTNEHVKSSSNQIHNCNIDFKLDTSDINSGYNCCILIEFVQVGFNSSSIHQIIYVSPEINITDKDDNSSWFDKIINAIKELPSNFVNGVKEFFENLGNKITELGDSIEDFFINLGENIGEFFTMLKNYILYFEHPVTLNDDGVLVDSSGNPIYTNPFASAMEKVKNTFNGWIDDIDQFVSDMDVSRKNVSNYISKGTSIINDVMSASPVLTACIIFVSGFLVIRKVVGR